MNSDSEVRLWRIVVILLLITVMSLNTWLAMRGEAKRDRMLADLSILKAQTEAIRREYVRLQDYILKQNEQDIKLRELQDMIANIKIEVTRLGSRRRD